MDALNTNTNKKWMIWLIFKMGESVLSCCCNRVISTVKVIRIDPKQITLAGHGQSWQSILAKVGQNVSFDSFVVFNTGSVTIIFPVLSLFVGRARNLVLPELLSYHFNINFL